MHTAVGLGNVASPGMDIGHMTKGLQHILKAHQKARWRYQGDEGAIEPRCLTLLALRRETGVEMAGAIVPPQLEMERTFCR